MRPVQLLRAAAAGEEGAGGSGAKELDRTHRARLPARRAALQARPAPMVRMSTVQPMPFAGACVGAPVYGFSGPLPSSVVTGFSISWMESPLMTPICAPV